jgi:hypothetical protein
VARRRPEHVAASETIEDLDDVVKSVWKSMEPDELAALVQSTEIGLCATVDAHGWSTAADARERLISYIHTLYQGRLSIKEGLDTKEWAMIGSLGDGITSGEIPRHYHATTRPDAEPAAVAYHYRIHEAGLKTQNYDKGFEKFLRKFERNEAMSGTVAILPGCREDHAWPVYCKQGPRRCLLSDTVDGI